MLFLSSLKIHLQSLYKRDKNRNYRKLWWPSVLDINMNQTRTSIPCRLRNKIAQISQYEVQCKWKQLTCLFFLLMAFSNHSSLQSPLSIPFLLPFLLAISFPSHFPAPYPCYMEALTFVKCRASRSTAQPPGAFTHPAGRPAIEAACYCSIFTIWHFVNGGGKSIQPVQNVHNRWWVTAAWFMAILLRELPYSCSMEPLSPFLIPLFFLLSFSIRSLSSSFPQRLVDLKNIYVES